MILLILMWLLIFVILYAAYFSRIKNGLSCKKFSSDKMKCICTGIVICSISFFLMFLFIMYLKFEGCTYLIKFDLSPSIHFIHDPNCKGCQMSKKHKLMEE